MDQIYSCDPLEALDQACYNYRVATFGILEPNEARIVEYRKSANEYKKAIKNAQKYLRNELKTLEKEVDYYANQRSIN